MWIGLPHYMWPPNIFEQETKNMRKFKVGDRVSVSMYGGATGTVRDVNPRRECWEHYRVEMDDKVRYSEGFFKKTHGRGHYTIPEGEMTLIEPPKFAVGDLVQWKDGSRGVLREVRPDGRFRVTFTKIGQELTYTAGGTYVSNIDYLWQAPAYFTPVTDAPAPQVGDKVSYVAYDGKLRFGRVTRIGAGDNPTYYIKALDGGPNYVTQSGYSLGGPEGDGFWAKNHKIVVIEPAVQKEEPVQKFKDGDKVTWGSGSVGYTYRGTMENGYAVLTDKFGIDGFGVSRPFGPDPWLGTRTSELRLVLPPKPKTRTVKVEIDVTKENGKYIAYAASEEEGEGMGEPVPGRVATKIVDIEVPA